MCTIHSNPRYRLFRGLCGHRQFHGGLACAHALLVFVLFSSFLDRTAVASVIVEKKADLQRNLVDYSLLLWRTAGALGRMECERILTMSSSSVRPAMHELTWLTDNETVLFLGEKPRELQQVYSFNTRRRILKRLTNHPISLLSYRATPDGHMLAFVAADSHRELFGDAERQHGLIVSKEWLTDLMTGRREDESVYRGRPELFLKSRDGVIRRIQTDNKIPSFGTVPWLSPDGTHIAIQLQLTPGTVPDAWAEYANQDIQSAARDQLPEELYSSVRRYTLIDTRDNSRAILMNSPALWDRIVWASDSQSLVVSGVYLPLEGTSGAEREARRSMMFTAEVTISNRAYAKITDGKFAAIRWEESTHCVVMKDLGDSSPRGQEHEIAFEKQRLGWRIVADTKIASPKIVLAQDLNTAPELFLVDQRHGRRSKLLDLNPQFRNYRFGLVEGVTFSATDGHRVQAGLYLPSSGLTVLSPLLLQRSPWLQEILWSSSWKKIYPK